MVRTSLSFDNRDAVLIDCQMMDTHTSLVLGPQWALLL